jgi:plastocyanin
VLVALLGVPAAVSATTFTVNCNAASFSPGTININTGDTIRWVFVSGFSHTVTNGTGGSDPGAGSLFDQTLSSGQSFEFTFTNAGSFDYFCRFHEFAGMKGTVVVASTPVTPATWGKVKNLFR